LLTRLNGSFLNERDGVRLSKDRPTKIEFIERDLGVSRPTAINI
jgi:hypothetical protein